MTAVILALLGGVPVVGQEDAEAPSEMKPATVMGEDVCSDTSCEFVMNDPRVSGEYEVPSEDEMVARVVPLEEMIIEEIEEEELLPEIEGEEGELVAEEGEVGEEA